MNRSRAAEQEQFSAYFAARYAWARRLAYLLCADWHRADDLVQAGFVRLASSWHRVRDPGALDSYLRTCILREFLSEWRRAWRRREVTTSTVPDRASGDDCAETAANRVAVVRALAQVPPRQRAVLILRFYDGLDVATAAQVLRCSAGTIKSQTARGLANLRAALGEPDRDDPRPPTTQSYAEGVRP